MEIYTHAVDNYLNRIIGRDPLDTSKGTRDVIREKIRKTAKEPERIHHMEIDKAPIHIRGKIAAVVGIKEDRDKYVPYDSLDDKHIVVPAVYHSKTFGGPNEEEVAKQRA